MTILFIFMLVILIILSIILFFIMKNQKLIVNVHNERIEKLKENHINDIQKLEELHEKEIKEKKKEVDTYKQSVLDNFKVVPYGERFIIRTILEMLRGPNFNNYTFYHQVEYQDNNQFYQLDFLVVSPFGVMVLESKYWNGVTYLYNKSYKDIFQNTLFKDFGVGSSERIKVFNARFLEDKEKEIVFSCYKNPVSQVRKYSHEIRKRLNLPYVKNAVVFHKSEINNVLFNDQEFNIETVDTYTKIITNKALKEYLLEELNDKKEVSREEIIDSIEKSLIYKIKFDKNNCQDKIFSCLLG